MKILISITVVLLVLGCNSEPSFDPAGKYEEGVFIVNEGAFGSGTGTLTFTDCDTLIEQSVYQINNNGRPLGNIANSIIEVNGVLFIAINNGGKIILMDERDGNGFASITGIDQPRQFANWQDQFLYASFWGADGISGGVAKIDLNTNTIVNNISTLGGPEGMTINGTDLYVAKSGGFGSDSLLLEFDLTTDELKASYAIGDNPINIEIDNQGTLWILCSGFFDFVNPVNSTLGSLIHWDNGQVLKSIDIPNGSSDLAMDKERNILYFNSGVSIMKYDMTSGEEPVVFKEGFYYSIEVDPKSGQVWATDAKDFASQGEAIIFDQAGVEIKRIPAGIIPGDIYFND